jgi:hypothetical protein
MRVKGAGILECEMVTMCGRNDDKNAVCCLVQLRYDQFLRTSNQESLRGGVGQFMSFKIGDPPPPPLPSPLKSYCTKGKSKQIIRSDIMLFSITEKA